MKLKERGLRGINERLTNKVITMRIQRDDGFTTPVVKTWEQALKTERGLPSIVLTLVRF